LPPETLCNCQALEELQSEHERYLDQVRK
jgi:hypothetical protein